MSVCIANAIAYLPPISLAAGAKAVLSVLESSSALSPWDMPCFTTAQRNLSLLFAIQSFFVAVTPHYLQRNKITKADLNLISELCPTFCFFDTLRVFGPEFETSDIKNILPRFFCLRSLELDKTRVDDRIIREILGTSTLHQFRFAPSAMTGGARMIRFNPAGAQAAAAAAAPALPPDTNISVWGLLKLFNHRDPRMRNSIAVLLQKMVQESAYLHHPLNRTRAQLLRRRCRDRHFPGNVTTGVRHNNIALNPPGGVNPAAPASTIGGRTDEAFVLSSSDDDENDDAATAIDPHDPDIFPDGDDRDDESSSDILVVLLSILRKLQKRFAREAGNETVCFQHYFFLAFLLILETNRGMMAKVRGEDMKYLVQLEEKRKELRRREDELFKKKIADDVAARSSPMKATKPKKGAGTRKAVVADDDDDDAGVVTTVGAAVAALHDCRKEIEQVDSDFQLPATLERTRIIDRCGWVFEHLEDCIESRNPKIREIAYESIRYSTDYFSILFLIGSFPHLFEKLCDALPPIAPVPLLESQKSLADSRDLAAFDERTKKATDAQKTYIYDPHKIKFAGQCVASTLHRAQVNFPRENPNPIYVASHMFIIRFFFKRLSLERLMSVLTERDVNRLEYEARSKQETDRTWYTATKIEKSKKSIQEGWTIKKQQDNTNNKYNDNDNDSNSNAALLALQEISGGCDNNNNDNNGNNNSDFFARFPSLDTVTRSILADLMRIYVPYCVAECFGCEWFLRSVIDLVGFESSPMDVKTKAVELLRDALGRDYPTMSLSFMVRRCERFCLVEGIFAVLKELDEQRDPVTWHQSQLFCCIAVDCLSLMVTAATVPEMKAVNDKCVALRDDLPAGPLGKQEELDRNELAELETLVSTAVELGTAHAQRTQAAGGVGGGGGGAGIGANFQLQVATALERFAAYEKNFEEYKKQLTASKKLQAHAITSQLNLNILHLLGRQQSETVRLAFSVPGAKQLLDKITPLVYPELRERTFNPIYLPLCRPPGPEYAGALKYDNKKLLKKQFRYVVTSFDGDHNDADPSSASESTKTRRRQRIDDEPESTTAKTKKPAAPKILDQQKKKKSTAALKTKKTKKETKKITTRTATKTSTKKTSVSPRNKTQSTKAKPTRSSKKK